MRWLWLLAGSVLLTTSFWGWFSSSDLESVYGPATVINQTKERLDAANDAVTANSAEWIAEEQALIEDEAIQAATDRKQESFRRMAEDFRQMQQQSVGNLQRWLHALWLPCRDSRAEPCLQLLAGLGGHLSRAEMAALEALLQDYQWYQQQLGEFQLQTSLRPVERFEAIRRLREEIFGGRTETLFGQEHQYAEVQFAVEQLQRTDAVAMSVEQRLEQLQQLHVRLADAEPGLFGPDNAYQQALTLLADLPHQQQLEWRARLQQKFFGADAGQVAAYEAMQFEQQQRMSAYQTELAMLEQQLEALRPELPDDEWQDVRAKALTALRLRFFSL